ncbi:plasmid-encoded protein PXO2.09 [Arthrobacter sp. MWB30]|nr:plasmid-encoded protein PXO2.09 [Arthrobacter sp. MWB30]
MMNVLTRSRTSRSTDAEPDGASGAGGESPARMSGSTPDFAAFGSRTRDVESEPADSTGHGAPQSAADKKAQRRAAKEARNLKGSFEAYPHLLALKPKEKYVFRSDYFEVDDDCVSCILGFFHDEAARDDFGAFWGINRIPGGLDDGVTVVVLEQVRRMGEKWIDEHTRTTEKLDKLDEGEQAQSGTMRSRRKAAKVADDNATIAAELQDGASYLHVHNRLLVKAPTLEALETSIEKISRLYIDRFGTVTIAAYPGEQRPELSKLSAKNEKKRGKGFHFTSVEFAGSHSLVTNGLNDATGEYVGYMVGDVNNSAVLFDVNGYRHHVVVADAAINEYLDRSYVADMWGSKISQSAMLNNGKTVHLVLNGVDLDKLGPEFKALTSRVDMNNGDVNMFEMFGDRNDELSIFSAHMQKLVLMAEQAFTPDESVRAIIRGELEKTATRFYIDQNMWAFNAKEQRDRLRIVGIPHDQVPQLKVFVTYLDTAYKSLANGSTSDQGMIQAYSILKTVFENLLNNNGDLFNTQTNAEIDGVRDSRRVIYDFSKLMLRGKGIAMAQLVNIVSFAVGNLGLNDTLVIHGTEHIDAAVKPFIENQLEHLFARGGRVAFLYNDVDKMLADGEFNRFDAADYTVLGPMRDATVTTYQKLLHQNIPPDLERLVTQRGQNLCYLRRGVTNVVFHMDLALGVNRAGAGRQVRLPGMGGSPVKAAADAEHQPPDHQAPVQIHTGQTRRELRGRDTPAKGRKMLGAGPRAQGEVE